MFGRDWADTDQPVPVIAGFHPYNNEFQAAPVMPSTAAQTVPAAKIARQKAGSQ